MPPTRPLRHLRRGFTLTELLAVLVVALASLSITVPMQANASREARIAECTQNMRQHIFGVVSFATANFDTFPNAPSVPGGLDADQQAILGPRGNIAGYYADADRTISTNGFRWTHPVTHLHGGFNLQYHINESDFFSNKATSSYNAYWHLLAEFMVEGEGLAALNDVFASPSHAEGRHSIATLRTLDAGADAPPPNREELAEQKLHHGSYRYVTSAMTQPRMWYWIEGERPAYNHLTDATPTAFVKSLRHRMTWLRRNPAATIAYPSNKVLFFLARDWHNDRTQAWFEPGSAATVACADGSARIVDLTEDVHNFQTNQDALRRSRIEKAGPYFQFVRAPDHLDPDQVAPFHRYTATTEPAADDDADNARGSYFAYTNGGIKGRDLR